MKFSLPSILILLLPHFLFSQENDFVEPELIFIDGGEFTMGCTSEQGTNCINDEKPVVNIEINDFWIGKFEITNAQYAEFLSKMGNQIEGQEHWYKIDQYALIEQKDDGSFQPKKGFSEYPVTNISWYGARAYTDWLLDKTGKHYRLPTEAEWEFAARGGQKSEGFIYSGSNVPEHVARFSDFAAASKTGWKFKLDKGTHPVGRKSPNELGIYDMSGNVSEWCWNIYENNLEAGINPKGPASGSLRVIRGGSWDNKASECRLSARNYAQHVANFAVNKGFRVAMDINIKPLIDSFAIENGFSGTILIRRDDKTIYHNSFGKANYEQNIPNTNETQFLIASITKLFTSTIILQLAEKDKIDLNKTIVDYLPDYKGKAGNIITIHNLLTHTSGIQNCEDIPFSNSDIPDVYLDDISTDEILNKYCSGQQITTVGTAFNYNNADYIILGKIIEKVTNDTYQNVLKKQILDPLEMEKTGLIVSSDKIADLAKGYKWNREKNIFEKDPERLLQNYYSAGAMYSTAKDLMKFSDALYTGELINKSSLELMLTTYPETRSYGYGLWIRYPQYNNTIDKVSQRFGQIWGINTLISHFIDHDITVIALANTNMVYVSEFQNIVGEELLN